MTIDAKELGEADTFRQLRGLPIHWRDERRKVTHLCEGADVLPGVRLLWTFCGRDVPASAAYLPLGVDPATCPACLTGTALLPPRDKD
jgi:hypothetical protein